MKTWIRTFVLRPFKLTLQYKVKRLVGVVKFSFFQLGVKFGGFCSIDSLKKRGQAERNPLGPFLVVELFADSQLHASDRFVSVVGCDSILSTGKFEENARTIQAIVQPI